MDGPGLVIVTAYSVCVSAFRNAPWVFGLWLLASYSALSRCPVRLMVMATLELVG